MPSDRRSPAYRAAPPGARGIAVAAVCAMALTLSSVGGVNSSRSTFER